MAFSFTCPSCQGTIRWYHLFAQPLAVTNFCCRECKVRLRLDSPSSAVAVVAIGIFEILGSWAAVMLLGIIYVPNSHPFARMALGLFLGALLGFPMMVYYAFRHVVLADEDRSDARAYVLACWGSLLFAAVLAAAFSVGIAKISSDMERGAKVERAQSGLKVLKPP